MTDRSIIELLEKRDEEGLREAERQYGQRLRRIAERLLSKEDAEECVNDVFLALWNHVPPEKPENLMAYMTVILKNNARNRWSAEKAVKRNAEMVSFSEEMASCIADPRSNTEDEAILSVMDVINTFLGKQKPERREMFILRYWYGLSTEEISEKFGFSIAKVEKTLSRMQAAFRKGLKEKS